MATKLRVTCINKTDRKNPHERIRAIGGSGWHHNESDAISYIENYTYEYYVHVGKDTVDVIIAKHEGRKYLKTENDGIQPDNLLSLPEC
jgi:histone H3/H4